jgi:transposase-like protein
MARDTKLDDLRSKRICDALRKGHSFAAAARAGGIDESTLHDWRKRGREGEEPYAEFSKRVDAADQEAEDRAVTVLRSAMDGEDLRLATDTAWKWLARLRPSSPRPRSSSPLAESPDGGALHLFLALLPVLRGTLRHGRGRHAL